MKKSEETLEDFAISYPLDKLAPLEQILFLDIETTGFTSRTSYLYMIGCAYYQAGKWRTIQLVRGKIILRQSGNALYRLHIPFSLEFQVMYGDHRLHKKSSCRCIRPQ